MKKLHKNNFILLFSSFALSTTLIGCTPSKVNNEQMKEEITTQVLNQTLEQTENIIETGKVTAQEVKERNKDKEIEEYIALLKQEILEVKDTAKEKWNSEETQEKINNIKQKSKDLFDFVVNGKEINGIKFKDLSDNGKEMAKNGLKELDGYIEMLIPNYKERFHDWTVDKGADALEKYDSLKEWYNNYKEEVTEEYNSRTK